MNGKIFIGKAVIMTEEDIERIKDIPMQQETSIMENPRRTPLVISYKIDPEGCFYIFNIFTIV